MVEKYSDFPWLKSYNIGHFSLPPTMKPYEDHNIYSYLSQTTRKYPSRIACYYESEEITYQELKRKSDILASALQSFKIQKGDCISTLLPSSLEFIIVHFAIMKIGAIHVPINPRESVLEISTKITKSNSKILFCISDLLSNILVMKDDTALEKIIYSKNDSINHHSISEINFKSYPYLISCQSIIETYLPLQETCHVDSKEDVAILLFTGGTTGIPKGTMLTHMNITVNVAQTIQWLLSPIQSVLEGNGSTMLCVPVYHMYGIWAIYESIALGFSIYLLEPRATKAMIKQLNNSPPTMVCAVPTHYNDFLNYSLPSLPIIYISGTAPLFHQTYLKFLKKTSCPICDGYGASETCGATILNFPVLTGVIKRLHNQLCSSRLDLTEDDYCNTSILSTHIGIPLPDVEVSIRDPLTEEEIPLGEPGELWIKGPQNMKGYWHSSYSGIDENGWIRMGDIAVMESDGRMKLLDRLKDMINVSGHKVYGKILDTILSEHPKIDSAAVIGIPDPFRPGSERIKAYLQPIPDVLNNLTTDMILDYLKSKVPPYAMPIFIEFREKLPRTELMKINKEQLKSEELEKRKEKEHHKILEISLT